MQLNKEAIAVTFLAMITAFIIAIIIILSNEALSTTTTPNSNNNDDEAPSPTPSSLSQIVLVKDPVVRDVQSEVHQVKNNGNDSLGLSELTKAKTKAIFVIGDSSVDCGENTLFYPLLRGNLSMFPCSGGSVSTLVHHFVASKMGLSEISSFYEQNGTTEGILNGLNFGSVGATILPNRAGPSFQSLNQQLRQSFETIQLLQLQLGEAEGNQVVKSSVFYVSLGKEDFISFLFQNESFSPGFNNASRAFGQLLANEMTNAVRNLYNAGARKIVVMGVLPLGCAPRAVVEWYFRNGRNSNSSRVRVRVRVCVNEINQHVRDYNQRLNDRIIGLNSEFSDARFVFCDVYQGIMELVSKPKIYGFEDVRGACCGRGWRGAAVGCQSATMACSDMSKHIWWDFYNPTEAVNSLLAESAWTGKSVTEMCRPISLQVLIDTPLH